MQVIVLTFFFTDVLQELCQWIAPYLPKERTMTIDKKLGATLWLLGNKESFTVSEEWLTGKLLVCFDLYCLTVSLPLKLILPI